MYRKKPQGWLKHFDFLLLDVVSLLLSFFLACVTRHGFAGKVVFQHYVGIFAFYLLAVIFLHVVNNTFTGILKRGFYREFVCTLRHVVAAELTATAYLFAVQQGADFSRIVIFVVPVYYLLLSYGSRILWKRVVRKRGFFNRGAALYVVVSESAAGEILQMLKSGTKGEYQIRGVCILDRNAVGEEIEGVPVTASMDTVLEYLREEWVDEVYIALPDQAAVPNRQINILTEMGITVHLKLEQAGTEAWQARQVQYIAGKPVQTISMTCIRNREAFVKRLMDICGGIVGGLFTVLLTVVLGPLIFIQSPGPIFFTQTRVGKNGKLFKMYKFRSMYPDAEERKKELMKANRISDGMMFKLDADPRIIGCRILPDGTVKKGIGNFIRDYSLDEFPQFFNVLKGDLSLVGTRPPTVDEWKKYEYHHRGRLAIKPGITGLWQVSGRSKITDFEKVVELDKKYIREWSIGLDLKILMKTVVVVLRKEGSM